MDDSKPVDSGVFETIVYVRYFDHVVFSRTSALMLSPQVREAVGWLVYECERYVTLSYDRDAGPPALKGGDSKESGLVLLKTDIIDFQRLCNASLLSESELYLNTQKPLQKIECALQLSGAKNSKKRSMQS